MHQENVDRVLCKMTLDVFVAIAAIVPCMQC